MDSRPPVTIVIPVADGDREWLSLALDLTIIPATWDILLCGPEPISRIEQQTLAYLRRFVRVRWVVSERSRAGKLNLGGDEALGSYVWFLHADSRVDFRCFDTLATRIARKDDALLFFRLQFLADGPRRTRLNEWGARLRSEYLRIPFGDQGFVLSKALWQRLGRFREDVPYGEDHLLVWRAHQLGVAVEPLPTAIRSSARKYRDQGWRHTTARHVAITLRQALPELRQLLKRLFWQVLRSKAERLPWQREARPASHQESPAQKSPSLWQGARAYASRSSGEDQVSSEGGQGEASRAILNSTNVSTNESNRDL